MFKNANGRTFTTGDIAKFCGVAPRTVTKWTNAGRLVCYHIPGSEDRRVQRHELVRFLRDAGFPLPTELSGPEADVLAVGSALGLPPDRVEVATDPFEAGRLFASGVFRVVILDAAELGGGVARAIARRLAGLRPGVRVGVIVPEDVELTLIEGADFVLRHPLVGGALEAALNGKG